VARVGCRGPSRGLGAARLAAASVLLLGSFAGASASSAGAADPRDAVLKVYATQLSPNYGAPWKAGVTRTVSGSGFVIDDHRILTNAHVVSDTTFIQVRKYGDSERVPARLLFVSHAADLALLTVDAPGFFNSMTPLRLGRLPELRQEVLVLGFPLGGDTLSVTRGVVSRIESQTYVHSGMELLAGQIDSAVNPGNSGGPVLADGAVVGIAMQVTSGTDNIAYMIPTPVVRHFLEDVADQRYDGVPEAGFRWQRLEAADLRRRYGLPPTRTGVLVLDTTAGSGAERLLRPGDVVLSVDGQTVGTDGTIQFREHERTAFSFLIQQHQIGERTALEILREGRTRHVDLVLDRRLGEGKLVPGPLHDRQPPYYIFGGLAFCPVSVNYVQAWGDEWWTRAPRHLLALLDRRVRFDGEQAVVLCSVMSAELNSGYEENAESLIVEADDQPVRNLRQLVGIIEGRESGLLVLKTQDGRQIALDRERARREGPAILARYQVPRDRSGDLAAATGPDRARAAVLRGAEADR
jgi:S1-C subfamily serine protease